MPSATVEQHFRDRAPHVRAIYDAILRAATKLGEFAEDPKKTSIHLNRKSAFAGIATRKEAMIVTIKAPHDIDSPRVHKHQHTSAHRWYLDVRLNSPKDVDAEFKAWLKQAWEMSG